MVFVHGFGGERTEKGLFDELSKRVVAHGYTAVLYDWRGVGGSAGAGDFATSRLSDHVSDFLDVVDWIRSIQSQGSIVHAVGFSLGAAIIGLAESCHGDFESVTYLSPAVRPNLSMFPRYDTPAIWESIQRCGYVEKEGSKVQIGRPILESLRDTDLGECAFALSAPLLVYQATGDERIPREHTQNVARASRECGANFRYEELAGASHSFRPSDTHWTVLGDSIADWLVTNSNV